MLTGPAEEAPKAPGVWSSQRQGDSVMLSVARAVTAEEAVINQKEPPPLGSSWQMPPCSTQWLFIPLPLPASPS